MSVTCVNPPDKTPELTMWIGLGWRWMHALL